MDEVQDVIAAALGGERVTTMVSGRERYGVNVRYPRELRSGRQGIESTGVYKLSKIFVNMLPDRLQFGINLSCRQKSPPARATSFPVLPSSWWPTFVFVRKLQEL